MISIKHEMEHMTETGKSTPYPNMTDEQLSDFEYDEYVAFGAEPLYDWDWVKK
jgi:hypothetical protein